MHLYDSSSDCINDEATFNQTVPINKVFNEIFLKDSLSNNLYNRRTNFNNV